MRLPTWSVPIDAADTRDPSGTAVSPPSLRAGEKCVVTSLCADGNVIKISFSVLNHFYFVLKTMVLLSFLLRVFVLFTCALSICLLLSCVCFAYSLLAGSGV